MYKTNTTNKILQINSNLSQQQQLTTALSGLALNKELLQEFIQLIENGKKVERVEITTIQKAIASLEIKVKHLQKKVTKESKPTTQTQNQDNFLDWFYN